VGAPNGLRVLTIRAGTYWSQNLVNGDQSGNR
jgi:hypothetical protein